MRVERPLEAWVATVWGIRVGWSDTCHSFACAPTKMWLQLSKWRSHWLFIFSGELTHLRLRNNRIATVDAGWCSNLTSLVDLELFSNPLNDVRAGILLFSAPPWIRCTQTRFQSLYAGFVGPDTCSPLSCRFQICQGARRHSSTWILVLWITPTLLLLHTTWPTWKDFSLVRCQCSHWMSCSLRPGQTHLCPVCANFVCSPCQVRLQQSWTQGVFRSQFTWTKWPWPTQIKFHTSMSYLRSSPQQRLATLWCWPACDAGERLCIKSDFGKTRCTGAWDLHLDPHQHLNLWPAKLVTSIFFVIWNRDKTDKLSCILQMEDPCQPTCCVRQEKCGNCRCMMFPGGTLQQLWPAVTDSHTFW